MEHPEVKVEIKSFMREIQPNLLPTTKTLMDLFTILNSAEVFIETKIGGLEIEQEEIGVKEIFALNSLRILKARVISQQKQNHLKVYVEEK